MESRQGCCIAHQDVSSSPYDFAAEVRFQERKVLHARTAIIEAEHAIREEEGRRLERALVNWRQESNEGLVDIGENIGVVDTDALYRDRPGDAAEETPNGTA